MALPPPNAPLICRVSMVFSRDTRQFQNTFHIYRSAGWSIATMTSAAAIFAAWWTNNYKSFVWSGVSLVQIQVRNYNPALPLAYDYTPAAPEAGLVNTPPDPASATLSTSWRTGLAGRKYRGRFYTVGMVEAHSQDNDTVTSAYVIAAGAAASALLANVVAGGLSLMIFHRIDNTFTQVVSTIVENLVDSQRRRLAGRGR